jgi:hypothetical protein
MISKQGNDKESFNHYDVHSLYGHSQSFATYRFYFLYNLKKNWNFKVLN